MNFLSRHKNTVVLVTVLLAQFLALAVQVKRQTAEGPVRLLRLLTVCAISPFERLFIYSGESMRGVWANYIDLRDVRSENLRLKAEAAQMRLERAREQEDARQAHRIQALLEFKERWIDTTVAAQVIGTSGTETSRLLYLDKGAKDGIKPDMPVITPDGVVGKVLNVYGETAQVLLINDPTSGVGAVLVSSRLQGVLRGTSTGEVQLNYIMGDETVQPGEALVTAGGDQIFPKGLPLGTVAKVSTGRNLFLEIKLKPAADLNRLEEVLVITAQKQRAPETAGLGPIRASDILSEHLPSVPQTPPQTPQQKPPTTGQSPQPASPRPASLQPAAVSTAKPASTFGGAPAHVPQNTPVAKPAALPAGASVTKPKLVGANGDTPTAALKTAPKIAPKSVPEKPVLPSTVDSKPRATTVEGTNPQ